MESNSKRKYAFDKNATALVKGVAIIIMIIHHCFFDENVFVEHDLEPVLFSKDFIVAFSDFGKICVGMFAFLSAYGMTVSMKRIQDNLELSARQYKEYTLRRYFNLMSGWLFVFAICQIFCWFMDKRQIEKYGTGVRSVLCFIIDGFGLGDLFGTPMLVRTWWYMGLAFVIIMIFPLLISFYKSFGGTIIIVSTFLIPRLFEIRYEGFKNWFLVIVLGIIFADKDYLAKFKEYQIVNNYWISKGIKLIGCMAVLVLLLFVREAEGMTFFHELRHGFIPVFMVYFSFEFLDSVKYLNRFLRFAGKHSMTIFLTHTYIRAIYFSDFIYSFRYPALIVIVLFVLGLAVAVVIDTIQEWCGYNRLMNRVKGKLLDKLV